MDNRVEEKEGQRRIFVLIVTLQIQRKLEKAKDVEYVIAN
jgi:hypothetical protein